MTDAETQTAPLYERKGSIWMRGLIMIVMAILFGIAETVLFIMAILQFFWVVFSGEKNKSLSEFGAALARWVKQVVEFQTMETDDRPFPWAPWPGKNAK
ncbi:MAG: DUF4389 domain-containing protein [Pseudomonadota bacterium]